jgi:hypothetical protein
MIRGGMVFRGRAYVRVKKSWYPLTMIARMNKTAEIKRWYIHGQNGISA